jgi:hypothetical protein
MTGNEGESDMSLQQNCPHQNTDDVIFRHLAVRNIFWRGARSIFRSLAEAARGLDGNLKASRNKKSH